jgi:hypothetical protein
MADHYQQIPLGEPFEGPADARRRRSWPVWLPLALGLALGLAIGLYYAWEMNPVQYYNTEPVDLRPEHQENWIVLVAAAYRQDGDLDRALSRLAALKDPQIGRTVAALTERYIQAGKSAIRIRALATLADALGSRSEPMLIYLATPEPTLFFTPTYLPPTPTGPPTDTPTPSATPTDTPPPTDTPTPTPTSTPTPRPSSTPRPAPTQPPPYTLADRERVCRADQRPRIEVVVQTEEGVGLPGYEIWVTWSGGADRFVTGLKPERGLGYADFEMAPDQVYAVAVGDPSFKVATGLTIQPCQPGEGTDIVSSWRLIVVPSIEALTPTPTPTWIAPTPSPRPSRTPAGRATRTPTATPNQRPLPPSSTE